MWNDQHFQRSLSDSTLLITSLTLSMVFGLVACNPVTTPTSTPTRQAITLPTITMDGNALPFETIEQDIYAADTGKLYEFHEPGMTIISRIEEIDSLDGVISLAGTNQLRRLDYGQFFALAAFQGRKGSIGYTIQINRISRQGNIVNVYAQLDEPEPDTNVGATNTSPYHLIKVQKTGSWGQNITFNLFSGDKVVASVVHTVQ